MLKTIMVTLDGFEYAELALPHAIALARRAGARLHLVHVLDPLARPPFAARVPADEWWSGGALRSAWDYLHVHERRTSEAGVMVTGIVLEGRPKLELIVEAGRCSADLIVMSTHGRGPLRRLWLGSVADHVSRSAGVPVMLIRAVDHAEPFAPPEKFANIMVALDGSKTAEAALQPALELARLDGGTLTLLDVAFPLPAVMPLMPAEYVSVLSGAPDDTFRQERIATDYLNTVVESLRHENVPVRTEVLLSISLPAAEIEHFALTHEIDLIVMATTGHSALASFLGGSVTDATIQRTRVPVLVVCTAVRVDAEDQGSLS